MIVRPGAVRRSLARRPWGWSRPLAAGAGERPPAGAPGPRVDLGPKMGFHLVHGARNEIPEVSMAFEFLLFPIQYHPALFPLGVVQAHAVRLSKILNDLPDHSLQAGDDAPQRVQVRQLGVDSARLSVVDSSIAAGRVGREGPRGAASQCVGGWLGDRRRIVEAEGAAKVLEVGGGLQSSVAH